MMAEEVSSPVGVSGPGRRDTWMMYRVSDRVLRCSPSVSMKSKRNMYLTIMATIALQQRERGR